MRLRDGTASAVQSKSKADVEEVGTSYTRTLAGIEAYERRKEQLWNVPRPLGRPRTSYGQHQLSGRTDHCRDEATVAVSD